MFGLRIQPIDVVADNRDGLLDRREGVAGGQPIIGIVAGDIVDVVRARRRDDLASAPAAAQLVTPLPSVCNTSPDRRHRPATAASMCRQPGAGSTVTVPLVEPFRLILPEPPVAFPSVIWPALS